MVSMVNRQILISVMALWLLFVMMPSPAESEPVSWIDQLSGQMLLEKDHAKCQGPAATSDRYLGQLRVVREALARGDAKTARNEMVRLTHMLGMKEEVQASDFSAVALLHQVGQVTPVEYLDDTARTRLLLIRALLDHRGQEVDAPPMDGHFNAAVHAPHAFGWEFGWVDDGQFHPIVTLGSGVLLLTTVGAGALLILAGVGAVTDRAVRHAKEGERAAGDQSETSGQRRVAA